MYEPAAVSSAASISPDTRNPTQLDELWIAGTTVNAAAATRVISTRTRSRRRIASENSPTARVTGTDEMANTTTPMAVTATGCGRRHHSAAAPASPTTSTNPQTSAPSSRRTSVSASAEIAATTTNTMSRTRGPLRAQDRRRFADLVVTLSA